MNFSIDDQEESRYLAYTITGNWVSEELKKFTDTIHAELMKLGYTRFIADMSLVSGPPPEMDRFYMGEYVASTLRGVKIAIVYRKVYANKLFEDTAVNRGARVTVFPDRDSALEWLVKEWLKIRMQATRNTSRLTRNVIPD